MISGGGSGLRKGRTIRATATMSRMGSASEAWTSDQAYEPFIGRWSRRVAPEYVRWLQAAPRSAWCDVGCGTGALSHAVLATESPARVLGVDPSEAYLAAAARGAAGGPFEWAVADATALP